MYLRFMVFTALTTVQFEYPGLIHLPMYVCGGMCMCACVGMCMLIGCGSSEGQGKGDAEDDCFSLIKLLWTLVNVFPF